MKIGIVTFHAAYNFGSVLQAYALQQTIISMGYDCEIINYRLKNQKEFYCNLYSLNFGFKRGVTSILRFRDHKYRKERAKKFECFISNQLVLSNKEYNTFEQLKEIKDYYDILITGSDQVWNINCPAEFLHEPKESILGYYLAFASSRVKKISYAASLGDMKPEQIMEFVPYINDYKYISVREKKSAAILSEMIGRKIKTVLDPTFLLDAEEWNKLIGNTQINEKYLLFYSLGRQHSTNNKLEEVKRLADRNNLKVYAITPFCSVKVDGVVELSDAGPIDFLRYLRDAFFVVTDSFHGSAFSINFNKPFYSLTSDLNSRIGQLLKAVSCTERMVQQIDRLKTVDDLCYDFSTCNQLVLKERNDAIEYLKVALRF